MPTTHIAITNGIATLGKLGLMIGIPAAGLTVVVDTEGTVEVELCPCSLFPLTRIIKNNCNNDNNMN